MQIIIFPEGFRQQSTYTDLAYSQNGQPSDRVLTGYSVFDESDGVCLPMSRDAVSINGIPYKQQGYRAPDGREFWAEPVIIEPPKPYLPSDDDDDLDDDLDDDYCECCGRPY